MKRAIFDLESDGLLPELTRIHCLVIRDMDTGQVLSCTDSDKSKPSIKHGLSVLRDAENIYGHNIIGFDLPAIQKVYPKWQHRGHVWDTLLMARFAFSDIKGADFARIRKKKLPGELLGSHSLKAWGYRLGLFKGTYGDTTDWAEWSQEMQTYCERDVEVTARLLLMLDRQELSKPALETEMELAFFLYQMEQNGFPLDVDGAEKLYATLSSKRAQLDHELREVFGSWIVEVGPFTPKRDNKRYGHVQGCPATKIKMVEFNPGSRDHIKSRLQVKYGWEPKEFTDSGAPAMNEDIMRALPYPEAPKLAEYLLVDKRIGQLAEGPQAWLKLCKPNSVTGMSHVHGRINQLGAVTHRATHMKPNMSQTPKPVSDENHNLIFGAEADYSTDMRNLWTVPEGWTLVGSDVSGLELRALAHFMARYDGGAYGKVVLEGDVHAANRDALGLEGPQGRHVAKNGFIYPFLYGAGDELIGNNLITAGATIPRGVSSTDAQSVGGYYRAKFLKGLPALGRLIDDAKRAAGDKGYLTVLDGRRIVVRHDHATLNTLLQSVGAVLCKRWLVEANRRLTEKYGKQGWDGQWAALVWSHDEVQVACKPEIADDVASILVESIRAMTEHFKFRCPLDGEAKQGSTWARTH